MIIKGSSNNGLELSERTAGNIADMMRRLRDRICPDDGYISVCLLDGVSSLSFRKDDVYVTFHKSHGETDWHYFPDMTYSMLRCGRNDRARVMLNRLRTRLKYYAKRLSDNGYLDLATLASGHVQILYHNGGNRYVHIKE